MWRSDEDLMLMYSNGDIDAFEILYRRYERPLLDFIYRLVMNPSEAENLYQETFYRVIKSKKKYKVTAQFKTWLFQIAINLCRDSFRKMKHRSHLSLDARVVSQNDEGVEYQEFISNPSADTAKEVESAELVSFIKAAVASLPEKEHFIFVMKEYQGMKFLEIADILNCPLGTVLSLNHRAQVKLRKILSKYVGD